jgi:hypothetical protein
LKRGGMTTSYAQRQKVKGKPCCVCGADALIVPIDPAHVIDRSLCEDDGDPRAVVPMCRRDHRAYDEGNLDLLPLLERGFREELAFAVLRFGLVNTYRRVTNDRSVADAA